MTLPLATSPSGIKCRYAALSSVLTDKVCSGKNLPCGSRCERPCPESLQCTAISGDESRCLQPCDVDADCTPLGITTCQDHFCKLAEPF